VSKDCNEALFDAGTEQQHPSRSTLSGTDAGLHGIERNNALDAGTGEE
jgi:hypothetical protein